ncbi:MAG: type II toxin-antitoxin system prevent-host-death family antitoxin [Acidobacteriota bacterium]|nr:type II toxin-antitoxin system prevent-host-death family antitoxin [Acidobacteriota bacterium]
MPTQEIGAFEAKTRLSELLRQVSQGRSFLITRRGRPVAELRPVPDGVSKLRFGCDKGTIVIGEDFDAPVPGIEEYTG